MHCIQHSCSDGRFAVPLDQKELGPAPITLTTELLASCCFCLKCHCAPTIRFSLGPQTLSSYSEGAEPSLNGLPHFTFLMRVDDELGKEENYLCLLLVSLTKNWKTSGVLYLVHWVWKIAHVGQLWIIMTLTIYVFLHTIQRLQSTVTVVPLNSLELGFLWFTVWFQDYFVTLLMTNTINMLYQLAIS